MKTVLLIVFLCLIAGRASPYAAQVNDLQQMYNAGQISASDYHSRLNEINSLEQQHRAQAVQQFQTGMQIWQQQQMINQRNQPQTIYLYKMGR